MPSVADESLQVMVDEVYATYGVASTYTNRAATAVPAVVVLDRSIGRYGDTAQISASSAVLCVRVSEVPLMPLRGETFLTADAETFVVDSALSSDGLEHRVIARKS